jgi:hypothetical protein
MVGVSRDDRERTRVLRFYPTRWRRRYGEELLALIEDSYGTQTPPLRCRLALMRSGATEWSRELGLTGSTASQSERIRAGTLVVLWAAALMLVAGLEFANISQGWRRAVPTASRGLPTVAYGLVVVAATAAVLVALAGAVMWVGPLARFLQDGGWAKVRRPVMRSAVPTAVTIGLFMTMRVWSRNLDAHQRDGGYLPYGVVAIALGVAVAASVFSWAATATGALRGIDPVPTVVRRSGRIAIGLAALMAAIAAGTVVWWAALAARAPWFLGGTSRGAHGTVAPAFLVLAEVAIFAAAGVAAAGARRVTVSLPRRS